MNGSAALAAATRAGTSIAVIAAAIQRTRFGFSLNVCAKSCMSVINFGRESVTRMNHFFIASKSQVCLTNSARKIVTLSFIFESA